MKKREERARTHNRYGTMRAQRTGRNNVWRVLRQLWYAKSSFGPSCRPATSPFRPRRSDKSEYIKEPRLRHEGTTTKRRRRAGKPRGEGEGGGAEKEASAWWNSVSNEVFTPLFSRTPFRYGIQRGDLTISYSSTPLEKLVKFASDTIVHLSLSLSLARARWRITDVVLPSRRRNTSRGVTRSWG